MGDSVFDHGDDEAELFGRTYRGVTLDLTPFSLVSIEDCVIESCRLVTTRRTEVRIARSLIRWSDLSGVRISHGCARSVFSECKLVAADFGGASVHDVRFEDSILVDVSMRMSSVRRVEFSSCTVTSLDAANSALEHVSFPDSSIERIDLDRARCEAVDLSTTRDLSAKRVRPLAGCRISVPQALDFALVLAAESGLIVALPDDDDRDPRAVSST